MTDPVLIELPVPLRTGRLLIRPPQAGDGAPLHEAISESIVELRRFLSAVPWVAAEQSVTASEIYGRNAAANFIARRDLSLLLFEQSSGQLLGGVGLHRIVWATPKVEVGYWMRTSRTGEGFVREAVEAIVGYAFTHIGAVRVELITDAQNLASRRVAERCGFVLEGVLRSERRAHDGSLRDTCVYARVAPVG